jgi:hypothetical protein
MAIINSVDAGFYKQVHRSISKKLQAGDGRRDTQRRGRRCVQRIAPCVDGRMPTLAAFREVECQDLSAGGFSYLLSEPPDAETLAVELGVPPVLIYVTARVINVSEIWQGGETMFLVGCRFTGRLTPDEAAATGR